MARLAGRFEAWLTCQAGDAWGFGLGHFVLWEDQLRIPYLILDRELTVCLRKEIRQFLDCFAAGAKPTSMRRVLAECLPRDPVVIVDQPVSLLRDKKLPGFAEAQTIIWYE
jgi:hypothetical protein